MYHHTSDLVSAVEAPSAARAALADALAPPTDAEFDLGPVNETARLLITELVSNSVRHAGTPAETMVRLDIAADPGCLRIEVHDEGADEPELVRAGRTHEGFGLTLVDRLADRWGIDHDGSGTRAWFELSLGTAAAGWP
ncbi:MAG TPA: ATP-binding protein [Actinomycetota bacterium]|nr:ATP-binding protein [Actinomycetota bacterium]